MVNTKKFNNNPIKEALIDIHIEPSLSVPTQQLEAFQTKLANFPEKRTIHLLETKFDFKEQHTETTQFGINGYQFWSADKTEVVHCRQDGFAFSRLKPYDMWEYHFPKMFQHWEMYRSEFNPALVRRIAIRFINQFNIPSAEFELKDYFNSPPDLPAGIIKYTIKNFVQKLAINGDNNIQAVITFSTVRPIEPNSAPILLDLDIFKEYPTPVNHAILKSEFELLHLFADEVFKSYITEKTEGLIE